MDSHHSQTDLLGKLDFLTADDSRNADGGPRNAEETRSWERRHPCRRVVALSRLAGNLLCSAPSFGGQDAARTSRLEALEACTTARWRQFVVERSNLNDESEGDDMDAKELARLAARLMSCPAAPFHEAGVRGVVESICQENDLDCRRDGYGNVLVQIGKAARGRALVLAAHMDHPGFEVVKSLGDRQWLVQFHGGVPDHYFRRGGPLRLPPRSTHGPPGRR